MERIVLPPVKSRIRAALLRLADYKDIPTEQLKQMARQLPGGRAVLSLRTDCDPEQMGRELRLRAHTTAQ